jgi:hypothetical protein
VGKNGGYSAVQHLARSLQPASSKRKFLFMARNLTLYADESGHADDPLLYYAGMAGFVAEAGAWEVFEGEWKELLRIAGVNELHMRHFVHSEGEFTKWKGKEHEPERQMFLGRAIEIIKNARPVPIGAVVSLRDFESLTESQRISFLDPYYVAFQACTSGAALQAIYEDKDERVAMVYSYNKEFGTGRPGEVYSVDQAGRAEQLWHAMKRSHGRHCARMGSYGSSTPREMMPLQAADLLAYELCHEFENQLKRPDLGMRWPLRQMLGLLKVPIPLLILYDRKELLHRVKGSHFPDQTGVEEVPESHILDSLRSATQWMMERAGISLTPDEWKLAEAVMNSLGVAKQ